MRHAFAAAALIASVLPGCSLVRPAATSLAGTSWRLDTYAAPGTPAVRLGTQPDDYTLAFGPDGQATGRTDCNRYFGAYASPSSDRLRLGPLGSTRMACAGTSREAEYLAALGRTTRMERDGNALTLTTSDGARLSFVPASR